MYQSSQPASIAINPNPIPDNDDWASSGWLVVAQVAAVMVMVGSPFPVGCGVRRSALGAGAPGGRRVNPAESAAGCRRVFGPRPARRAAPWACRLAGPKTVTRYGGTRLRRGLSGRVPARLSWAPAARRTSLWRWGSRAGWLTPAGRDGALEEKGGPAGSAKGKRPGPRGTCGFRPRGSPARSGPPGIARRRRRRRLRHGGRASMPRSATAGRRGRAVAR